MEQAQKIVDQVEETTAPKVEIKPSKSVSQLTRVEREELNALSKELFGSSSRWQKLVNTGYTRLVTEEVTELVPHETDPEGEPTTRKVQVPIKRADGAVTSVVERHTVDSVRDLMVTLKKGRDAYLQKAQEAKEAAEAAKKVQEEVGGSAGL